MKEITDESVVKNIIGINLNNKRNVPYFKIIINDGIVFLIFRKLLDIAKMNLGLATLTIPFLLTGYIISIAKCIKDNNRRLKLNKKKIKGVIEKLNEQDIFTTNLDSATLIKDKHNNSIKILFFDSNRNLQALEEKVLTLEDGKKTYKVYLLNEKEKNIFLNNNEVNIKKNKFVSKRGMKYYHTMFKLWIIYTILITGDTLVTSFNIFEGVRNADTILDYYDGKDKLSDEELDEILSNIEKNIRKVSDDEKFNIDNITTYEELDNYLLLNAIVDNPYANLDEKEIMYNFIDFFNDNPSIDREKVYANLEFLEFNRDFFPFSDGYVLDNNDLRLAYYVDDTIVYKTNIDDTTKAHEVFHAIFDTKNIPSAYVEGMAELLENEYFNDGKADYDAYNKNVILTKATIELIGRDKFLEAFNTDDLTIIRDGLIGEYLNNNKDATFEEAVLYSDKLIDYARKKLSNNTNTIDIANTLVEFFRYANYDTDKKIRLFEYKEDLSSYYLNIEDVDYYYFNRERQKELVKH